MEMRVRKDVSITENQFSFMPGRSTTAADESYAKINELILQAMYTFDSSYWN